MGRLRQWTAGSRILYREVYEGKVWTARPVTVIQDNTDLIALFFRAGTRWKKCASLDDSTDLIMCLAAARWRLVDATWPWDSTVLVRPGEAHAVHVMRGDSREFVGWYINLQEPVRRTAMGFDFMDQELDIVVKPGLSNWEWKDEELFERAQAAGRFTGVEARAIRAEAERVIARIRAKASPFCDGWENWSPPPEWPIPALPNGWDTV